MEPAAQARPQLPQFVLLESETQEPPHPASPAAQHRLFEQFPLVHWLAFRQEPPLVVWATHAAPVQYLPEPHGTTLLVVQAPAPLHTEAVLIAESLLHDAALHTVSPAG